MKLVIPENSFKKKTLHCLIVYITIDAEIITLGFLFISGPSLSSCFFSPNLLPLNDTSRFSGLVYLIGREDIIPVYSGSTNCLIQSSQHLLKLQNFKLSEKF